MSDGVKTFTLAADQTTAAAILVNSWSGLGRSDPRIQRQDIYITGTFGSGTATLRYSVDGGANWIACLADKDANIISLTSAGVMTIKQRLGLLGIHFTGSSGASITVLVV